MNTGPNSFVQKKLEKVPTFVPLRCCLNRPTISNGAEAIDEDLKILLESKPNKLLLLLLLQDLDSPREQEDDEVDDVENESEIWE